MPSSGIGEKIVAPGEFKHICSLTWDPDATSYTYSYGVQTEEVEDEDEEENEEDY
jgi:hypothetical protein